MAEGHIAGYGPRRSRYFKPRRLHVDKAYDVAHLRRWLRGKRIGSDRTRGALSPANAQMATAGSSGGPCRGCPATASPRYEQDRRSYMAFLGDSAPTRCYKQLCPPHHVGKPWINATAQTSEQDRASTAAVTAHRTGNRADRVVTRTMQHRLMNLDPQG